MNRGLARRSVFECRSCVRFFLSRLARAVRRGELEVHAYAVLTTHFHLLVRSPAGHLSTAMRRTQNEYVRWFNRRNRRDGPLFRGRFHSRRVESTQYWRTLVRYIDQNASKSGLVARPEQYPYGSAWHYARDGGPRWFSRRRIENDVVTSTGESVFSWAAYRRVFGAPVDKEEVELVERRLEHRAVESDPLDELVSVAPEKVRAWMHRKASLADSTRPGIPCVAAIRVVRGCRSGRRERPDWTMRRGRRNEVDMWRVLEVALLRDLAGLRWREIASRLEVSPTSTRRLYEIHRVAIAESEPYRQEMGRVVAVCLG